MRPSEAFRLLPKRLRVRALRATPPAMLRLWLEQTEAMKGMAVVRGETEAVRLTDAWIVDLKAALLGSVRA